MTRQLDGRVAVVTGGASGIGAVYSAALVREGATVYLADIVDGRALAEKLSREGPGRALDLQTDVADESRVASTVATVVEAEGCIDILVNNAALFAALPPTPYHEVDVELWDRVMAVNLRGPFLMVKHVGPVMAGQGYGKIINISSGTALKGLPMMLPYVTSKGGVLALTRTLSRELGPSGVCVNSIAPGFTLSDTLLAQNPKLVGAAREPSVKTRALQRDQMPEDLVGALVFLASPASDFVTGQTLLVDGGQLNT